MANKSLLSAWQHSSEPAHEYPAWAVQIGALPEQLSDEEAARRARSMPKTKNIRDVLGALLARRWAEAARVASLEVAVADLSRRLDHHEQHGPLHYSRTRLDRHSLPPQNKQ